MFVPPGLSSARSYLSGSYEPALTALFTELAKEGMTVVDVGANIGYYTLLAQAAVGSGGRVYSFEPDPKLFQYLMRNVAENRCAGVTAINKAVSRAASTVRFRQDPQGSEGSVVWTGSSEAGIDVEAVSLDDLFGKPESPRVDLVKIDAEGSENAVLEGTRSLVRRNPQVAIILELNQVALARAGTDADALAKTLAGLGFTEGWNIEYARRRFSLPEGIPRGRDTCNLLLRKGPGDRSGPG